MLLASVSTQEAHGIATEAYRGSQTTEQSSFLENHRSSSHSDFSVLSIIAEVTVKSTFTGEIKDYNV